MPSANGYRLEIDGSSLVASWAAPYFVLEYADPDWDTQASLTHCDDLAHAQRILNATCGRAIILDAQFEPVPAS